MALEHHDVLIVGAGLSGIAAACHLRRKCPEKSFAILEARQAIGGTWDLFRYPGIRSDSDMFTLGYSFAPWTQPDAIADGERIRNYIRQTARDHGVEDSVRFGHRVVSAEWSSQAACWTVGVERDGAGAWLSCDFLFVCSGYYDYEEPFAPEFPGSEQFAGRLLHPQHWPEDLDYSGRRVLVIGSGATAVTLVPAMAERAAHVTMLQRSPTYIVSLPSRDALVDRLHRSLPDRLVFPLARWKNTLQMTLAYQASRRWPRQARQLIRREVARQLPEGYDVDTHFNPRYNPWEQRLCVVPDGDLFRAIRAGRATVVTDEIETFTERGVRLASGGELEADVIVTATGLNLVLMGGIEVSVDGRRIDFADTVVYKGMMFSGVPNLALAIGYTNASWTLKCDLVCHYVCRLLDHMDRHGYTRCLPLAPDPSLPRERFMDLSSGYIVRALDRLPTQGPRPPWRVHQNYLLDLHLFRCASLEDEGMQFSRAPVADAARPPAPVSELVA
jgi:cation diffusion facilitator CzcD-associated flavoprotein CzcO